MTEQPEALRLAERLDDFAAASMFEFYAEELNDAAAELRRLHQSEREGWRYADELEQERKRLHSVNAQLLEALERLVNDEEYWDAMANARAAIAAAKEMK